MFTDAIPIGVKVKVELNHLGQGVGKEASQMASWMGTRVRTPSLLPVNYPDWRGVPKRHKDDVFKEVLQKYEIESNGYKWAYQVMGKQWKTFKGELKQDIYDRYDPYAEWIENHNDRVPTQQWKELIHIWEQDSTKA
ncbi:hypothetical protein NE237_004229 [Protea cynaroides]|uniref:Uncharacterized protein n=1 Tax=Protea cynaroides TaxID=273540 RepID=A0A9Q0QTD3_9MAGN|nr:hypothetical protein NE237_004229 [Protea cynaroides]